ncbi:MAG: hypothetical protein CMP91_07600 [Gammaproteobacteria bacterium]|nr:hypothetical protein [Gammaproteobacteria bacterium]MAY03476.1 hypothetical protein [Gammaproteobacteria bacterium]|tara:strand:- start:772 stop:1353 length:582 start_codon:yes stop_codon:yes gene_type:complete
MRITTKKYLILGSLILFLQNGVQAQSVTVLGGNESARNCYQNAQFTDSPGMQVTSRMLEPCNYALEQVQLNRNDRAATFTNRGILLYRLREYDSAFNDFENALLLAPDQAEVFVNRGNAYYMTGEYQSALEDYESALRLGISQTDAVFLNLGMTYERLDNDREAISSYQRALEARPEWNLAQRRLDSLLGNSE